MLKNNKIIIIALALVGMAYGADPVAVDPVAVVQCNVR